MPGNLIQPKETKKKKRCFLGTFKPGRFVLIHFALLLSSVSNGTLKTQKAPNLLMPFFRRWLIQHHMLWIIASPFYLIRGNQPQKYLSPYELLALKRYLKYCPVLRADVGHISTWCHHSSWIGRRRLTHNCNILKKGMPVVSEQSPIFQGNAQLHFKSWSNTPKKENLP